MHLLEVNNVLIAASNINQYDKELQLLRFEHDIELKKKPLITTATTGKKINIVPDAIIEMQGTERRVMWIELERGTNKDSDILAKMHDIYDVFDTRAFQERVQTNRCRVCYLTTAGPADMERLLRLARNVLEEKLGSKASLSKRNLIFNFIRIHAMGEKDEAGKELDINVSKLFLQPSWSNPFGNTLSSIMN